MGLRHLLKTTGPDAAPGFTELPWLTTRQNEQRRVLHGLLARWPARTVDDAQPKAEADDDAQREAEVDEAVSLVSRIEQDLSRAEELLQGMRTRLLTEVEWSELTVLVERARADTPRRMDSATHRLGQLVESGSLRSAEARSLGSSLRQLVDAHEFLTSEALPWRGIVARLKLLPWKDSTSTAEVESRVVPGTAFASSFERGYSSDANAGWFRRALSPHVPCLAQTTLTGAGGRMLFRGLHRGFAGLPQIDPMAIRALSHADLSRLVSERGLVQHWNLSPDTYRARVEQRCLQIRYEPGTADWAASIVEQQAGAAMVRESAAAALCSDPAGLHRALGGETAEIRLLDVSMLSGNDMLPWCRQYDEQLEWEFPRRITLILNGPDREPHRISANASVRQFALSVDDQGHNFTLLSGLDRCVVQLLGEMDSRGLGGDVQERVGKLRFRVRELGRELAAAGYEQIRTLSPGALEHPGGLQAKNRVTALLAETSRLDGQARALEQAAQQLKDMWRIPAAWPTGADAYEAAARLALVAYLMGETPVLSCASGTDCSRRLDAEVKILATVTDCRSGQVPPPFLDTGVWDPARNVLRAE